MQARQTSVAPILHTDIPLLIPLIHCAMQITQTLARLRHETIALLRVGWPLIVNNLSITGIQLADTLMASRLDDDGGSLAAIAVGSAVWLFGFMGVLGLLMAISPLVARQHGAGRPWLIGRYARQGMLLGVMLALPLLAVWQFWANDVLAALGIDDSFRGMTADYLRMISWGAPAIFVFLALRYTTEGIGVTRPIMYASLVALACNVFLNWVLMFGKLGAPALGVAGCGLASAITMWTIALLLGGWMAYAPAYRRMLLFVKLPPLRPDVMKQIVRLGAPIAVTILAEVGLFNGVTVLMGRLGATIAAAHQVALNFAATMFMVPLALSSAITVRVGQAVGRGDMRQARFAGALGIAICTGFMACSATFMLLFRDTIISLYTPVVSVQAVAVSLLIMAAVFQVVDGMQVGAVGSLRGYRDTRVPMVICIIAYWGFAFPAAYAAAEVYELPPHAVWAGFVIGLSIAALLLTARFVRLSRRAIL